MSNPRTLNIDEVDISANPDLIPRGTYRLKVTGKPNRKELKGGEMVVYELPCEIMESVVHGESVIVKGDNGAEYECPVVGAKVTHTLWATEDEDLIKSLKILLKSAEVYQPGITLDIDENGEIQGIDWESLNFFAIVETNEEEGSSEDDVDPWSKERVNYTRTRIKRVLTPQA